VALYFGGVAWTMVYDTIYAMQDQRDDAVVGVKSTARRFAAAPRRWLTFFAVLALVLWTATGLLAPLGVGYFVLLACVAAHFVWQIALLKPHDPADCLMRFKSNRAVGWLMLAALVADRLY